MITIPLEIGKHVAREAIVFLTEALAKINAREVVRAKQAGEELPCCPQCAGCALDLEAPLCDATRLLDTKRGPQVAIVAFVMGHELAAGRACRAVLIEGQRLAYQLEDGSVLDPISHFEIDEENNDGEQQRCCCGDRDACPVPAAEH